MQVAEDWRGHESRKCTTVLEVRKAVTGGYHCQSTIEAIEAAISVRFDGVRFDLEGEMCELGFKTAQRNRTLHSFSAVGSMVFW